jgi:hypothetical protein
VTDRPGTARHRATTGAGPPTSWRSSPSCSFLGAPSPVGLVLGIVARGQIRRTGEAGDGLALAAVIVGGVLTTLLVVGLPFWILVLASIDGGAFAP